MFKQSFASPPSSRRKVKEVFITPSPVRKKLVFDVDNSHLNQSPSTISLFLSLLTFLFNLPGKFISKFKPKEQPSPVLNLLTEEEILFSPKKCTFNDSQVTIETRFPYEEKIVRDLEERIKQLEERVKYLESNRSLEAGKTEAVCEKIITLEERTTKIEEKIVEEVVALEKSKKNHNHANNEELTFYLFIFVILPICLLFW